jgi:urease accessory protein
MAALQKICGTLNLEFAASPNGGTLLKRRFRTGLFHLGKPYWDGQQLVVQVINPTAGIFEGDSMDAKIRLGSGSRVCLLSPSSTQVYSMPGSGNALATQSIHLADQAQLTVLPRWMVLHAGARLHQRTEIHMAKGSGLFFVDLISAGRRAYGEFLEYDQFCSLTEIHLDGRLLLRENLDCGNSHNRWIWKRKDGCMNYLVNAYVYFPGAEEKCSEKVLQLALDQDDAISFGITFLNADFLVIRLGGESAPELYDCLGRICKVLADYLPVSTVYSRIS